MGILRSDRVSGLGGANAINGSAFFPQNTYINVEPDSDLDLPGDFTIEMWVRNLAGPQIAQYQRQLSSKGYYTSGSDGNWYFGFNKQSGNDQILFYTYDGTGSAEYLPGNCTSNLDQWYHIAASRSGNTLKLFVDGAEEASGTISKGLDDGGNNGLFIGGISKNTGTSSWGDHYGWISNLRIIKGRALYTAAFTPPTGRLEQTSDTVLLCCQSPGNVLEEKTGKILSHNTHNTAGGSKEVSADRLAPDVGEDHGTTFTDNTKFDTLSYMVPPGGTTAESNRGRGVMGGFYNAPNTYYSQIDYLNIQSLGNSIKFGDLTLARTEIASCSSSTRALFAGGAVPGPVTGGTKKNEIDYVTIATTANATDFGDLTLARRTLGGCSNETRGIFGGGVVDPGARNEIDYVTIATVGNATDFGDLSVDRRNVSSHSSTTRGIFAAGLTPSYVNTIDYITIATTGNATDFGDTTAIIYGTTSCSNSIRGLIMGGTTPSGSANTIDYVTIATTGNATDFGDITVARGQGAGIASPTRGLMVGGEDPSNRYNTIDYVTIATTGNASDFGDAVVGIARGQAGSSDCHGGIS